MKKKPEDIRFIFFAVILVLSLLGFVFTFMPISNPLNAVGGTAGTGMFFASFVAIVILLAILIVFAIKSSLLDILRTIGEERGVDVDEIIDEFNQMVKDDALILIRRKKRYDDSKVPVDDE